MPQFDAALLKKAKNGDDAAVAALIVGMMPAIRKGAANCAGPGLDFEDAVQEGLIGLFTAIKTYDTARSVPFAAYAAACVANAQTGARRAALRKKHAPLNFSVPLPEDSAAPGPEEMAIAGETWADVRKSMETLLSPLERDALVFAMEGRTTAETAEALGRSEKTVENALGRARRKLRKNRI